MTLFASLNGTPVTRARIVIPYAGIWHADIWLDRVADTSGPQALLVNGLSMTGTVVRQIDFAGESSLRLVGGGGGWSKPATPQLYKGANVSTILGDTATSVGEQVHVSADRQVSPFYVVSSEDAQGRPLPASQVLQELVGDTWWMDPSGVVQTSSRPTPTIASPFTVRAVDGPPGVYHVDTDTIGDWMPGATFAGPTASGSVSRVTHILDSGTLHTEIMIPTTTATDRLRLALEGLLSAYLPNLLYLTSWAYTVVSVSGGASPLIDANPVDARLPPVAGLPLRPGPDGGTAVPPSGSTILLGFVGGDPTQPEVRSLDPNNPPTTVYLGGVEGPAVARLGDTILAYLPPLCPISGTISGAPFVGSMAIPGPLIGSIQSASSVVNSA